MGLGFLGFRSQGAVGPLCELRGISFRVYVADLGFLRV